MWLAIFKPAGMKINSIQNFIYLFIFLWKSQISHRRFRIQKQWFWEQSSNVHITLWSSEFIEVLFHKLEFQFNFNFAHPKAISEPQSIMFPIVSCECLCLIFMPWMVVNGLTCTYCYRNMSPAGGSSTHTGQDDISQLWKYVMKIYKMGVGGGNCRFYWNYCHLIFKGHIQ